jgi:hypothetical protein
MNEKHSRRVVSILQRPPKGRRCLIVNWGSSEIKYPEGQHWIVNPPKDVEVMSDKLKFFRKVGHNVKDYLQWTEDHAEATKWGTGGKVFVRGLLRASSGRGIYVWSATNGDVDPCPRVSLYTLHQKKTHEYRIHMARSLMGTEFEPILIQRKVWKQSDTPPTSWDVRNHDNGFIFQSHPTAEKIPGAVLAVAKRCMSRDFPEMHFAALDVLYHKPTDVAVVCEGNTAPGLENNSVDVYSDYLMGLEEEFRRERMVHL